jgi:hypothetical protein
VDDDYTRCQAEGARLRELGYAGVVAPSAALPGFTNVTVFGRRMLSTWGTPSRLASSIPACIAAVGRPAPGLASRVRHIGMSHSAYEAYLDQRAEDVRIERLHVEEEEEPGQVRREPDDGEEEETAGGF